MKSVVGPRGSILFQFIGFLVITFTGLSTFVFGQTSRGTLTGSVTEPSGAVVADANVTITQNATGVTRQTTTNSSGIYRFDAVDLGTYTLAVQAPGFATERKTGIEVQAARVINIDFNLKIGNTTEMVTVEASGAEVTLQTSEQVRGEHFAERAINNLPLVGQDSLTLAQLIPGVALGSNFSINQNGNLFFAVNGQRPRGNNFMIDGVENNDISISGPAYTITNADAVQEVSVQTSNFTAEFGRAGGAVFNQVTKSGTDSLHGTLHYQYSGNAFKALDHADVLGGLTKPPRRVENIPSFTIGGPVIIPKLYNGHRKTFFFGAAQWDRIYRTTTLNVRVPTAAGAAVLQSLASQCPNAALYLKALGNIRGNPGSAPSNIDISVPSATGTCNNSTRSGQSVQTALFTRQEAQSNLDNNHQIRVDHVASEKQTLSFRWLYDRNPVTPTLNNLPGFDRGFNGITLSGGFSDTYVISPSWTNEFRFNYGRIGFDFVPVTNDDFHFNLPNYTITGLTTTASTSTFGRATNMPQFRFANNWQYQDTMSKVYGTHTFRFGVDFLRQLARQHPPFNERGSFGYSSSTNVTALANFLDDFGGNGGALNRQFGISVYHPNLFRHSYFFQDSWKTTSNLTLNLGLRYENFGTPVNIFNVAAFTDYDPVNFATPHKVNPDNNNFAPTIGFAWNPKSEGMLNRIFGGEKTVWRGGYQVSYDTWFNNLLSNIAGSSPNTLGGNVVSSVPKGSTSRGVANFSPQFAGIVAAPPTKESAQSNLFDKNIRNPYTQRFSLGVQRELPLDMVLDLSYVGSVSRKLFRSIDMNPIVNPVTGDRLHPELQSSTNASTRAGQGIRSIRASTANSNYEAFQMNLRRRFSATPVGQFQLDGSYTWSHFMDEISDVFGQDSTFSSFQSVSQVVGVSPRIDYGDSDFDRRHVGAIAVVWDVRGPNTGVLGQTLGGWSLSAISHWQTGLPYTLRNGTDRNGDGQNGPDRPDVSNPFAPLNTRAVVSTSCSTGFADPDNNNACISPSAVHFIEGTGAPNAFTSRRNALRANGIDKLDLTIAKRFSITERAKLEYRVEMFNALNTINFADVPARTVNGSAAGSFLDFTQDDSTGRSMRMGLKLSW